jgi:peptide-methionine (R)-S-oxide reductase
MHRRQFILTLGGIALLPIAGSRLLAGGEKMAMSDEKLILTEDEWRARLTPEQFNILREEGTERPFTSPLLNEKREGIYQCVACDNPLFASETKYDSGTGWPSFYDTLEGAFETRKDFKLIWPRTEYHCARCGGHHGHVFNDGPKPTGLRYCNNGVALKFVPTVG